MSIAVDVGLLSGRTVSVEAGLDESVATLKRRAQTALAVRKGRLFDSSARLLDEQQTVKKAKLETGTSLTLHLARFESVAMVPHFRPSWATHRLLPGATKALVATAVLCKIS